MLGPILKRPACMFVFVLLLASPVLGQSKTHIFARFADGRLGDGTYYKSTLSVIPWFDMDPANCNLTMKGGTIGFFDDGTSGTSFNQSIPAGGFWIKKTTGTSNFQGGYATVTCDEYVFANIVYSFYSQNGVLLGEATVFSPSLTWDTSQFVFDHSSGSLYGIAIANDTDLARVYDITVKGSFGTRTTSVVAGARGTFVGILQDLVILPPGARGTVRIQTRDFENHAAIALRFTGGVFTTVPAQ